MITKMEFPFGNRGASRTLHVYLPDAYDWREEKYPVMYFFDGQNLYSDFDATYGTSWAMKAFLDSWGKEMIMVGIECSHEGDGRLDEYSPWPMDIIGHHCKGYGEDTMQWIIKEVKPMIDRSFRTWTHREATAIAGSSMGGLMALYAVVKHNDVFGKAACVSSSIAPCRKMMKALIDETELSADTRIWLSYGEAEDSEANRLAHDEVARSLEAQHVALRRFLQPKGQHNEYFWRLQVPAFMSFLWLEG